MVRKGWEKEKSDEYALFIYPRVLSNVLVFVATEFAVLVT